MTELNENTCVHCPDYEPCPCDCGYGWCWDCKQFTEENFEDCERWSEDEYVYVS